MGVNTNKQWNSLQIVFPGFYAIKHREMEQSQLERGKEHRISEAPVGALQNLFEDLCNIALVFMH